MRSEILPAEHVFALFVNLVVLVMVGSSLGLLLPRVLTLSAKVSMLNTEVRMARDELGRLEGQVKRARVLPQGTARAQANLVPRSRVSIFWGR